MKTLLVLSVSFHVSVVHHHLVTSIILQCELSQAKALLQVADKHMNVCNLPPWVILVDLLSSKMCNIWFIWNMWESYFFRPSKDFADCNFLNSWCHHHHHHHHHHHQHHHHHHHHHHHSYLILLFLLLSSLLIFFPSFSSPPSSSSLLSYPLLSS